ncbi:hypothetical protein MPF19_06295 [Polaribacter sp. Z014]|uniref:hypothetical protein n=1 Tax=Polaribacter sp. Z014 TaxID=2927126 RepID=UPI002020E98E|nr:hypothetical protein [Polaribacter sp. Z014]MCL7763022.1 hypothetical protein [Polaribacter sp. Z014]
MKVFKEKQRFRQTWLILVLIFSTIVPIAIIIKKHIEENTPVTIKDFLTTIITIVVSIAVIFLFKLTSRIDEKGIHYQFFPLHFSVKTIPWNEISKAYVRKYQPITEFGGWGIKGGFFFNKGREKAVNVSGNIGIQLLLKDGEKLLIGTQLKEEAKRVLETYSLKIN